jgi:hypothetical protein
MAIIRVNKPKMWIEQESEGDVYLYSDNGDIMAREYWQILKLRVDAFYADVSDEEINEANKAYAEKNAYVDPPRSKPVYVFSPGYIYLVQGVDTPWYKIGITRRPSKRFDVMGVLAPFECKVLGCFPADDMINIEKWWHSYFADKRTNGEWFLLDNGDIAMFIARMGKPIP